MRKNGESLTSWHTFARKLSQPYIWCRIGEQILASNDEQSIKEDYHERNVLWRKATKSSNTTLWEKFQKIIKNHPLFL